MTQGMDEKINRTGRKPEIGILLRMTLYLCEKWVLGKAFLYIISFISYLTFCCSAHISGAASFAHVHTILRVYFALFCKFEFSSNLHTKNATYRLYVLFNKMRTNNDEKIIEHIMESRNTDKIMKLAKIIKSWNPGPRKCRIQP